MRGMDEAICNTVTQQPIRDTIGGVDVEEEDWPSAVAAHNRH